MGFVVHAPHLRNGNYLQAIVRPAREASFRTFPFFVLHKWEPRWGCWQGFSKHALH